MSLLRVPKGASARGTSSGSSLCLSLMLPPLTLGFWLWGADLRFADCVCGSAAAALGRWAAQRTTQVQTHPCGSPSGRGTLACSPGRPGCCEGAQGPARGRRVPGHRAPPFTGRQWPHFHPALRSACSPTGSKRRGTWVPVGARHPIISDIRLHAQRGLNEPVLINGTRALTDSRLRGAASFKWAN